MAHFAIARTHFAQNKTLRRSDYLRELTLNPGAEKEIRVFGLQRWLTERFLVEWDDAMAPVRTLRQRSVGDALIASMPLFLVVALITSLTAYYTLRGAIHIGEMAVLLQCMLGIFGAASVTINDTYVELGVATLDAADKLEGAITSKKGSAQGSIAAAGLPKKEIQFKGVHFRYPSRKEEVFTGLDLTISAGKSLAIVGENGSGKTTLIKLLSGLLDPTEGAIEVDGIALPRLDIESWERRVAAVFQDFVRYPWSAAENIGLSPDADLQSLRAVASDAGILEVIESLPDGWNTRLSRQFGGVELSGGQWQRIALARALFAARSGANLLILDEPTAQLDARQEASFYEKFIELTAGHTTIIASHRFSSVRLADRIVVIEGGSILEAGTHVDLVAAGGKYRAMFSIQAERFKEEGNSGAAGH